MTSCAPACRRASIPRRPPARHDPQTSSHCDLRVIHAERRARGPATSRHAADLDAPIVPAEVLAPDVLSRIEQGHQFACIGILRARLCAFKEITADAREPEVLLDRCAASDLWNDMLNGHRHSHELL